VERETGKSVRRLRHDRGGEFFGISNFCTDKGVLQEFTSSYNPESNGLAERANGTLLSMMRAMLHSSKLMPRFWGEAANLACYIKNCVPLSALPDSSTPYEFYYGKVSDLSHLRIFGARCKVFLPVAKRDGKLSHRSFEGIFLGYSRSGSLYRVWGVESRKVTEERDVKFWQEEVMGEKLIDIGDKELLLLPRNGSGEDRIVQLDAPKVLDEEEDEDDHINRGRVVTFNDEVEYIPDGMLNDD